MAAQRFGRLMIEGDQGRVTSPEAMFWPVVEEYKKVTGLNLQSHFIAGDHAFSWSRLALTQLLRDWLLSDCR